LPSTALAGVLSQLLAAAAAAASPLLPSAARGGGAAVRGAAARAAAGSWPVSLPCLPKARDPPLTALLGGIVSPPHMLRPQHRPPHPHVHQHLPPRQAASVAPPNGALSGALPGRRTAPVPGPARPVATTTPGGSVSGSREASPGAGGAVGAEQRGVKAKTSSEPKRQTKGRVLVTVFCGVVRAKQSGLRAAK
jgi:hypothetical protein